MPSIFLEAHHLFDLTLHAIAMSKLSSLGEAWQEFHLHTTRFYNPWPFAVIGFQKELFHHCMVFLFFQELSIYGSSLFSIYIIGWFSFLAKKDFRELTNSSSLYIKNLYELAGSKGLEDWKGGFVNSFLERKQLH